MIEKKHPAISEDTAAAALKGSKRSRKENDPQIREREILAELIAESEHLPH